MTSTAIGWRNKNFCIAFLMCLKMCSDSYKAERWAHLKLDYSLTAINHFARGIGSFSFMYVCLSRSHESRRTPKLCTGSVWGSATYPELRLITNRIQRSLACTATSSCLGSHTDPIQPPGTERGRLLGITKDGDVCIISPLMISHPMGSNDLTQGLVFILKRSRENPYWFSDPVFWLHHVISQ